MRVTNLRIDLADVHGMASIAESALLKLHRISGFGFEIDDPIEP